MNDQRYRGVVKWLAAGGLGLCVLCLLAGCSAGGIASTPLDARRVSISGQAPHPTVDAVLGEWVGVAQHGNRLVRLDMDLAKGPTGQVVGRLVASDAGPGQPKNGTTRWSVSGAYEPLTQTLTLEKSDAVIEGATFGVHTRRGSNRMKLGFAEAVDTLSGRLDPWLRGNTPVVVFARPGSAGALLERMRQSSSGGLPGSEGLAVDPAAWIEDMRLDAIRTQRSRTLPRPALSDVRRLIFADARFRRVMKVPYDGMTRSQRQELYRQMSPSASFQEQKLIEPLFTPRSSQMGSAVLVDTTVSTVGIRHMTVWRREVDQRSRQIDASVISPADLEKLAWGLSGRGSLDEVIYAGVPDFRRPRLMTFAMGNVFTPVIESIIDREVAGKAGFERALAIEEVMKINQRLIAGMDPVSASGLQRRAGERVRAALQSEIDQALASLARLDGHGFPAMEGTRVYTDFRRELSAFDAPYPELMITEAYNAWLARRERDLYVSAWQIELLLLDAKTHQRVDEVMSSTVLFTRDRTVPGAFLLDRAVKRKRDISNGRLMVAGGVIAQLIAWSVEAPDEQGQGPSRADRAFAEGMREVRDALVEEGLERLFPAEKPATLAAYQAAMRFLVDGPDGLDADDVAKFAQDRFPENSDAVEAARRAHAYLQRVRQGGR